MGSSGRYASSASAESGAAQSKIQSAYDRRFQTEEQLRTAEGLLGTDAQAEGNLFGNMTEEQIARSMPFAGKYVADQNFIRGTLEHAGGYGYKNTLAQGVDTSKYARLSDYVEAQVAEANKLRQQAGLYAINGDMENAEKYNKQAEDLFANFAAGPGSQLGLGRGISLQQDEQMAAKAQLSTPQARTVGELVRQGRQFLDRDSETSQAYRQSLTEEGERALAVEAQSARRMARDFGATGGSSRNIGVERAQNDRLAAAIGRERADLYSRAASQYEQFSRAFAADTVGFAQQWLQGGSFVRESFQSAADGLTAMLAEINIGNSNRYNAMAANARVEEAAKKANRRGIATGLLKQLGNMTAFGQAMNMMNGGGGGGGGDSGGPISGGGGGAPISFSNIYSGAKSAGSSISSGASSIGNSVSSGASTLGGYASSAGSAIYSGASSAGSAVYSGASAAGSAIYSGVSAIGSFFSDMRVKENVEIIDSAEVLDGLNGWAFNYKWDKRPQIGVMAQELEHSPLRGYVSQTAEGIKQIDVTPELVGTLLGLIADMDKRIKALEADE